MFTGLAALGILALFLYSQGLQGGKPSAAFANMNIPQEAAAELQKLQKDNKTAYATLMGLFSMPPPPVIIPAMLTQYAMSLYAGYPTLAQFLAQRAKDIMTPTTGASGTQWYTWSPGVRSDGSMMVAVLFDATPVLSYTQQGENKATRKLVSQESLPGGLPPDLMAKAKADFSV